jgi:hypothetical protein
MAINRLQIRDHVVTVPGGPGLGVTPDEDYLAEHVLPLRMSVLQFLLLGSSSF